MKKILLLSYLLLAGALLVPAEKEAPATPEQSVNALKTGLARLKADKELLGDVAALEGALRGADEKMKAAVAAAVEELAVETALNLASMQKIEAAGGKKEKALEKIAELAGLFKPFERAAKIIDEAKTEIENDRPGVITGEWWHGGAIGAAYFTGDGARKAAWFENIVKKTAKDIGMPYQEIHTSDVLGGASDENGILLYPDGAPRVRFAFMPGGDPGAVMKALGKDKGCRYFKQAFDGGMDYVGICSGCCLVMKSCFAMWPGTMKRNNPQGKGPDHDFVLLPFHWIAREYKNNVVKQVEFTGGINEMTPDVPGTEYLAAFENGGYDVMRGHCAVMAYRDPSLVGGRLVVTPAHPEVKTPGFVQAMCAYSMRHSYALPKKRIEIGQSVKGVSGDLQNQYYEIPVGENVRRLTVSLTELDGNCRLILKFGEPPREKKVPAPVKSGAQKKYKDVKENLSISKPGIVFALVHGSHDIENGANYTLSVTAEEKK